MQTNEELVHGIRNGDGNLLPILWDNIAAFAYMKAEQFARHLDDPAIDVDDLKQVGYFAMLKAVEYYDESKGYLFLTYLKNTLLKEFYKAAGFTRQKHSVVSLNAEIGNGEKDDSINLLDTIEDMEAQQPFTELIEADWQAKAFFKLLEAMELLSENQQLFIWEMYFNNKEQQEAGALAGYSCRQSSSAAHRAIMWKLRHCSKTRELWELLQDAEAFNIGSLPYHATAEKAAMINMILQKRRGIIWQEKTLSR